MPSTTAAPTLLAGSGDNLPGVGRQHPSGVSRRVAAALLAAPAWLLPITGTGGVGSGLGVLLLGLLVATAITPGRRAGTNRLGMLELLPLAFVFGILGITVAGLLAGWANIAGWSSRPAALATWTLVLAVPLAVAAWRGGRTLPSTQRSTVAAAVATGTMLAVPLVSAPFEAWSRSVAAGTDFSRHVAIVLNTLADGSLDYAGNPYPRSIHASLALLQQASGETGYSSTWQATQLSLMAMLGLIALATSVLAERATRSMAVPERLATIAAPALAVFVTLTGLWVSAVLRDGFLTTVLAGLIIAAASLSMWDGMLRSSARTMAILMALSVAMAHAWLILVPVVAAPAAWLGLTHLRSRSTRLQVLAVVGLSAIATAPILIPSITDVGLGGVGAAGGTSMPMLGIQWLALVLLAGLAVSLIARGGAAEPGTGLMLMLVSLLGLEALLMAVRQLTDGGWYYAIKTGWTPLALLVGLAVPAVLWLVWRSGRALSTRRPDFALPIRAVAATVAVAAVFALAWTASPVKAVQRLYGLGAAPVFVLPLMEQFLDSDPARSERPVLVWGLSPLPRPDAESIEAAGKVDFVAAGALWVAGHPMADLSEGAMLLNHDPVAVCSYLQKHPETLRITGPDPAGSLGWLVDAGCSPDTVRADEWISITVDPAWYVGTEFEGTSVDSAYPSWEQSQAIVEELRSEGS